MPKDRTACHYGNSVPEAEQRSSGKPAKSPLRVTLDLQVSVRPKTCLRGMTRMTPWTLGCNITQHALMHGVKTLPVRRRSREMEGTSVRSAVAFLAALAAAGCQTISGIVEAPIVSPVPVSTTPVPTMPAPAHVESACRFETPLEVQGPPFEGVARLLPEDEDWESRRCREFAAAAAALVEIGAEGAPLAIPVRGDPSVFRAGLRFTLTGRLFNHGETGIRESAETDIGRFADDLYRGGRTGLVVIGHSDASGSTEFNFELSHRRAVMVAQALVRFGVLPDRITVAGRGETQPIADNDTEDGRARNRRIEILEYPDGEIPVELVAGAYRPMSLQEAIAAERRAAEIAAAAARNALEGKSTKHRIVAGTLRAEASPFNFGGAPAAQPLEGLATLLGTVERPSIWDRLNPLRQARARETTESLNLACIAAELQEPTFQEGLVREDNTSDLSGPWVSKLGLYGTAWAGRVNGQLVTLADMAVLAKGTPETAPMLYVHDQFKGGTADADIRARGAATATLGEEGLLYRAYFQEDAWPIRCIDLVFDRTNPGTFRHGRLYYENHGRIYAATYEPEFVKN